MPSAARHAAPTQRTALRRVLGTVSLTERLLLAALATVLLWVGLTSVGGTYAMWADEATVEGTALTTGTAELTAQWGDDPSTWQNLLPGDAPWREITVKNTGDVPLALHAAALTVPEGLELRMTDGSETRSPGPGLSAALQPLTESGTPLVVEPGQTVCIHAQLTATPELVPGHQHELTIELEGRQVA